MGKGGVRSPRPPCALLVSKPQMPRLVGAYTVVESAMNIAFIRTLRHRIASTQHFSSLLAKQNKSFEPKLIVLLLFISKVSQN